MKPPASEPPVPRRAQETVRQAITALLANEALSAKEISAEVRIAEKEVYGHLGHIQRSLKKAGGTLEITPAECRKCGFSFAKRERLSPPGKCPVCRHQAISDPLFVIRHPQGQPAD